MFYEINLVAKTEIRMNIHLYISTKYKMKTFNISQPISYLAIYQCYLFQWNLKLNRNMLTEILYVIFDILVNVGSPLDMYEIGT